LYSALAYLNSEWRNIVTLEDPIERIISGINQCQVSRDGEQTFSSMLPALLRQDPDVIMLSEIRDAGTAETALTFSLTGHLVLSTIHAGDCVEAFVRLSHLQVSNRLLRSAVRLLVSQRLLPLNCRDCSGGWSGSAELSRFFGLPPDFLFRRGHGCPECGYTGTAGRKGVFEMLPFAPLLENVLNSGARLNEPTLLRRGLLAAGFQPLAVRIRECLIRGEISPESALRAMGIAPELFGIRKSG
jgi:type II secretory ATPase GspE/PulE/Tfp pilus assembly ATPase PilB-like protein